VCRWQGCVRRACEPRHPMWTSTNLLPQEPTSHHTHDSLEMYTSDLRSNEFPNMFASAACVGSTRWALQRAADHVLEILREEEALVGGGRRLHSHAHHRRVAHLVERRQPRLPRCRLPRLGQCERPAHPPVLCWQEAPHAPARVVLAGGASRARPCCVGRRRLTHVQARRRRHAWAVQDASSAR
jgi:hypothetical protein